MQLGADYYLSMATSGVGSRVLEAFLSEKNSIPLKKKFAIIDALQGHYATVISSGFPLFCYAKIWTVGTVEIWKSCC